MDIAWHTLTDLRRLIDRKEASALEVTNAYLARIDRADNTLHAFTEVYHDAARALALAADAARARSSNSPKTRSSSPNLER